MSTSPARNRPNSQSPRRPLPASPKRRPLHERSDSETNSANLASRYSADLDEDQVYRKDPFPRLPSQFLSPKASFSVLEDGSVTQNARALPPPPRPVAQNRTKPDTGKPKRPLPPEPKPRLDQQHPSLAPLHILAPKQSQLLAPSLVSLRRQQLEALDAAARHAQVMRDQQLASRQSTQSWHSKSPDRGRSMTRDGEWPTSPEDEAHDRALLARYQSLIKELPVSVRNSAQSISTPARARSQSSKRSHRSHKSQDRGYTFIVHQDKDEAPAETPEEIVERPRSASTPARSTDAMIEALMNDGVNVEYPRIEKPSMTSLRTDSSSLRRAYPRPLRLNRKRAESQLARVTSMAPSDMDNSEAQGTLTSSMDPETPRGHLGSRYFQFDDGPDLTLSTPQKDTPEATEQRASQAFPDELEDTVGELGFPQLRQQRSGYIRDSFSYRDSFTESRPGTSSSTASQRTFFYTFLNDSYTAWAPPYYRGEGGLRLEASPRVTNVGIQPLTPQASFKRSSVTQSSLSTGPSSSPSSTGYPQRIYIPRIRPMASDTDSMEITPVHNREISQSEESWITCEDSPAHQQRLDSTPHVPTRQPLEPPEAWSRPASQPIIPIQQHRQSVVPRRSRSFRQNWVSAFRLHEPPHLQPDKRTGNTLHTWKAPSLETDKGPFGRLNRQYWLLIIGFLFPPAWFIASFLPVPPRPQWRRGSTPVLDGAEPKVEEADTSLFDEHEVRRYRKACRWRVYNRFMSVAGVCIIAVIIAFAIIGSRS